MAIFLSLLSSLLWGGADFMGGLVSRRRPALVVVGWSAGIGFVFASVAVAVSEGWHGPLGWLPWGMAAGAAGACGLICYYLALATGTMGVVAPVTSLGVIVPIVFGLLIGEVPTTLALVGMGIAIVGIVLTSGPEFSGGASPRPVLIAALGGLCFGAFFVFADHGSEDSPLLTLWTMRMTVATAFVAVALVRRTTGGIEQRDYSWLLIIAAGDLGANLFFGIASTMGYVSITSVLSSLFPVVTVLLARAVLKERLKPVQIAGAAVTMLGVALISAG
ncbi:MAG: DMT family transporter [Nocardioidaceae bacterium]